MGAGVEPAALRRLVAWMRKDKVARLDQEAVDDQYRYIVGLRRQPAQFPDGGQLATAAAHYAENLTIREVAKKMGISVGKAHSLKMNAGVFNVQQRVNMNTAPETSLEAGAPGSGIEEPGVVLQTIRPFPRCPSICKGRCRWLDRQSGSPCRQTAMRLQRCSGPHDGAAFRAF